MKKTTTLLLLAIGMATAVQAQLDPLSFKKMMEHTLSSPETVSAHNYTTKGGELLLLTATRKDTINFANANYLAGAVFTIICTNSSNDSTLILPVSGTINGGASYWFNGTYKHSTWWYDGTNYWLK